MAIPAPGSETTTDEFARYITEGLFANDEMTNVYYLDAQKQADIAAFVYTMAAALVTAGAWTVLANKTLADEFAESICVGIFANIATKNIYYIDTQKQTDIANFVYTMANVLTTAGGY